MPMAMNLKLIGLLVVIAGIVAVLCFWVSGYIPTDIYSVDAAGILRTRLFISAIIGIYSPIFFLLACRCDTLSYWVYRLLILGSREEKEVTQ